MAHNQKPKRPLEDCAQPVNLEAEKSVLGAILIHNDALGVADALLEPQDFYRTAHQQMFSAMLAIQEESAGEIDLVTLKAKLSQWKQLDDVGGPAYIASLVDGVPHATNVEYYAQIVKEQKRLRDVLETAAKLRRLALDGERSAADVASDAADQLYDFGGSAMRGQAVLLKDLVTSGIEALEVATARRDGVTGLSTGFRDLDDLTAGMHPGDLLLLAARTSVGKTALALNIARHVAASVVVLVFSLEMSKEQVFMRLFAAEAQVDSQRMRTGRLHESDWPKLANAMGSLSELQLLIDDMSGIGVREVRSRSRQVRTGRGLGLIIVDYVQLMRGRGRFENRTQEVGSISHGLKEIAKELQVPVLALSQLKRESEGFGRRGTRKPQLSDLRESGDLEQDADVVLLIWRPEQKEDGLMTVTSLEAEVIVAKQRNGPVGTVQLQFQPEWVKFESV